MDKSKDLEVLYHYAAERRFKAFNELWAKAVSGGPDNEFPDAYLMRAQIKLFAADETFLEDLETAGRIHAKSRFPCLNSQWLSDSPNRFIVFSKKPDALQRFLQRLPEAKDKMEHWFGKPGGNMVRQIQSEIFYFTGRFTEAINLAEEQQIMDSGNHTDEILLQCVLFRCHLATGNTEKAEQNMLNMIRLSEAYPECRKSYQSIRTWANLTTGWSGDSPRFCNDFQGKTYPVLDDRQEAIRMGFDQITVLETPFIEYAEHSYDQPYTMRQYYMDIFHALYWFQTSDFQQTESHFLTVYNIAAASGLIMPLAEVGGHIIPLLQHIRDTSQVCSPELIGRILSLAEQYEENTEAYRG
ncbi:tetratricopeptide repeat protein [Brucepastera parasyntrophica]|uniref:tetratricopeptide repeat protein n=1 Tax=Brucepastera parasyntrophica TaxID=2880008 RepID=UPI00210F1A6C|nr:tetratricopeptide repeat protein [Brucepastera parasyntrophica]ULQ60977.1 tetratricopeptide repeat protein [Brucepastera parasyntrophica]